MKHIYAFSLSVLLFLPGLSGFSQGSHFCATDMMRQRLIERYPEILQWEKELQDFTDNFHPVSGQRSGPIIIPIVFHIIHRGGTENITDAQVKDEVRILNEDYNKQNADIIDVIPSFQSIVADIGIDFRLATKDPQGNCTNGIEHIWGSQTYGGNDLCKLSPWPRDKYLNVWVYRSMAQGVAGYAYLPGSVKTVGELPMIDGINILSTYIGSIGTSSYYTGRALTHEIGHFFNLKHPWGDSNAPGLGCGDDNVFDTPETKGWDHCPAASATAICHPPVIENYQNYMEYSYCDKMFTNGQKDRMLATLNSDIAQRLNLWSDANLIATGTDNVTPSACAPICDFSASKLFACVGDAVTYSDNSYNGDITYREWSFPGANVTFSNNVSESVTYDAAGVYPVTLDVMNANGNATKTQSLVTVKDTGNLPTPYYTGFEDKSDFDYWWSCINTDRDEAKFQYCPTAGRYQSKSVLLNTYRNRADMNIDELISPPFDCTGLNSTTGKLSFYYSFATWNSQFSIYNTALTFPDSIVVLASKSCTGNWVKIYSDGSNNLFNAGFQNGYFVPGADEIFWKKLNISIPNAFWQRNVRFRVVVMSSHEANNFYLDDFNIGSYPTGIDETAINDINLMPNPFTSTVRLENLPDEQLNYELRDITGRLLASQQLLQNNNSADLDLSAVSGSGVYLFTLRAKNALKTYRLVKQ